MVFDSLATLIFLPLVGALILLLSPARLFIKPAASEDGQTGEASQSAWWLSISISILTLLAGLVLLGSFKTHLAVFQFEESSSLLEAIGLEGTLGIDGISLWLVALTTLLTPVALLASMKSIAHRCRTFAALILLVEGGAVGALCATDLLTFFIFLQLALVSVYFLTRGWSDEENGTTATQFLMYIGTGSALLLIGILSLADKADSFQFSDIIALTLQPEDTSWLAIAFSLGFLIQMAIFPLHGWYTDSVSRAPTAVAILISGVVVNLGAYGLLRFAIPLFAGVWGTYSSLLLGVATLGVLYGSLRAAGHSMVRRVVAFASLSHLSLIVLGSVAFNESSIQGLIVVLVSHSVALGIILLLESKLTPIEPDPDLGQDANMYAASPLVKALFGVGILSLIGLPLTGGFIGLFLVISSSFGEGLPVYPGLTATDWPVLIVAGAGLTCIGFVLSANYGLKLMNRIQIQPKSQQPTHETPSLSSMDLGILTPLVALVILIGIHPAQLIKPTEASVNRLVADSRPAVQLARDAKRTTIRVAKRKQAARPGPGRMKKPTRPQGKEIRGKKLRPKGAR